MGVVSLGLFKNMGKVVNRLNIHNNLRMTKGDCFAFSVPERSI